MKLKNKADVFISEFSQVPHSVGKQVFAFNQYLTLVGSIQGAEHVKQRAFACTRCTDNGHHFAFLHMDVHALQHLE